MKILAICPNPNDITALYRVVGPLSALHREDKIELTVSDKLDYIQFNLCDVVLIQRPASKAFLEYCNFVKNWNKPLWLDFDDDLLNVPEDNPAYVYYGPAAKEVIIKCLKLADLCTVSTDALKTSYDQYCNRIEVVPNALDLKSLPQRNINWEKRDQLVLWRGGGTHEPDVFTVRQQIIDLAKAYPNWKFVFMGHDFKWLKWELGKQYIHVGKMDPAIYMKTLGTLQAPIHIVPLVDNLFNRAKSNIALLEATWAGSAVIAPGMPEWSDAVVYNTPDEFKDKLQVLLDKPNLMKQFHDRAWDNIQQNYLLSKVNKQRLKLISELK